MLTYEEDNDWDDWDGGYWGNDIYQNKKQNKNCKYFCISFFFLLILSVPIIYLITGGKVICVLPFLNNLELCQKNDITNIIDNVTNYSNTSLLNNYSNFTSIYNYNTSLNNNVTDNQTDYNSEKDIISENNILNSTNNSNLMLYQNSIRNDIENKDKSSKIETGSALLISILSVLAFLIIIVGIGYLIKNGGKKIKNICTIKTASKHNIIQLTNEELEFYQVKNPIQEALKKNTDNDFVKAVNTIKKAIEKDSEHEYDDAIKLYNNGIDLILKSLKHNKNGEERFLIAKKIDIYVKRVNYITKCKQNQELINDVGKKS
jgi:hypothetical protein